jgi:hypothetical protein
VTPRRIVGFVLLVLGFVVLLSGGVFWKQKDKVLDAGPLEVTAERHRGFGVPPVVGGLIVAAGILLIVLPGRNRN